MPQTNRKHSALDRALGVIAEVRPGEGATALWLALDVLVLLAAYYLIKPVREALILASPGGAELKAYAGAGSALLLLALVPVYGRLAGRLPRNRLIGVVSLCFALCLVGFHALGRVPAWRGSLGVPFYLWVSVFNMMVVAQAWAFANDIFREAEGKRLFAIVGLGASLGAVLGSKLTSLLLAPPDAAPWPQLSVFSLMPISAALLMLSAAITELVHRRELARRGDERTGGPPLPAAPPSAAGASPGVFRLVRQHRYLGLLALFSLLFTCANSNGEYILGKLVAAAHAALPEAERAGFIGAFYGDFYFWVNVCALSLQALGVSRIVRHGELRVAFTVLPLLVLLSSTLVVMLPVLGVLRLVKIAENATDYSLNNTVRNMLWLPTTREMKYKAKMVVDTFMVRIGDVSTSVLVFAGTAGLEALGGSALGVRGFAALNLLLSLAWLWLARVIVHENARLHGEPAALAG